MDTDTFDFHEMINDSLIVVAEIVIYLSFIIINSNLMNLLPLYILNSFYVD